MNPSAKSAPHPLPDAFPQRSWWTHGWVKTAALALVILLLALAVRHHALATLHSQLDALRAWFGQHPVGGPLLYLLGAALAMAVGCPRLLLCTLAGMSFGLAEGFWLGQMATVMGAWLTFALARHLTRQVANTSHPWLLTAQRLLATGPIAGIFLVRQLPITAPVLNLALALAGVRHRDFLVGSFLGYLPQGLAATLVGSGLLAHEGQLSWLQLALGLACLAAAALLAWRLRQRLAPAA